MPPAHKNCIIAYHVTGNKLEPAREFFKEYTNPDRIHVSISYAYPGGEYKEYRHEYRVGDFFEKSEIIEKDDYLELVVHIRENADRYWKDLMVGIARDLEELGFDVSHPIHLGDKE